MSSWELISIVPRGFIRVASDALLGIGIVLLGFSLFGWSFERTHTVSFRNDRPIMDLSLHGTSTDNLVEYANGIEAGGIFDPREATLQVFRGTQHSDSRRIHPAENWMQWALGWLYPPMARLQDSDRLIAGQLTNCSERSQILMTIATSAGCECRFVGLQGHVVLEIRFKERWIVSDPDYGVVFPLGIHELEQPRSESYVRGPLTAAGHSPVVVNEYLRILRTRDDNRVLPAGSPLSPRLYLVERFCQCMTWLLPLSCLLGGWLLLPFRRTRPAGETNPGDGVRFIHTLRRHRLWFPADSIGRPL